jgi:thiosulfate/3-mercaptopyruvate sulfurtransferase
MEEQAMTGPLSPSPLVQTEWLAAHLDDPDLRIVDVRFRARVRQGRGNLVDDRDGYVAGHIPGAVFVGTVTELSDPQHPIPDMLVRSEQFAEVMGRLGIGDDTLVVAYDGMGLPVSAARLWWALSYFGHDRVRVLDGGLQKWQVEGRPLSTDVPTPKVMTFTPRPREAWLASKDDVASALVRPATAVVDCLFPELYHSTESHLWGDRPGHIPGAVNIPYLANADPALATTTAAERDRLLAAGRTLTFASPDTLAALYAAAGVTPDRAVITYCGRGYAASCGLLALKVLGYQDVRLYDGSWTEWSADPHLPVEVTSPGNAAGVGKS